MSYTASTLLLRNLHDVFGGIDPLRRRVRIFVFLSEARSQDLAARLRGGQALSGVLRLLRGGTVTKRADLRAPSLGCHRDARQTDNHHGVGLGLGDSGSD